MFILVFSSVHLKNIHFKSYKQTSEVDLSVENKQPSMVHAFLLICCQSPHDTIYLNFWIRCTFSLLNQFQDTIMIINIIIIYF